MFQDLALFPHRDVFDNVAFGLRMIGLPRAEIETRVRESLALVGLGEFVKRDVNLLSGGEQQRVALARSLAPRPRLLMFDEPLGALDRLLREQLIADMRAILKRIGMTALYVTHDQIEAMAIADRLAILHDGRIEQIGAPEELYDRPATEFVVRFLDLGTVIRGRRSDDGRAHTPLGIVDVKSELKLESEALLLIRPEHVRIVQPDESCANVVAGIVTQCLFQRGRYRLTVEVNGVSLHGDVAERKTEGEVIHLCVEAVSL